MIVPSSYNSFKVKKKKNYEEKKTLALKESCTFTSREKKDRTKKQKKNTIRTKYEYNDMRYFKAIVC